MSQTVTDKFGTPIQVGDYVLCKFGSYGGSSELAVGKIEKINRVRHEVRKCNDQGIVLTYSHSQQPQRMRMVDKHNMVKMQFEGGVATVKAIKKMTL